MISCCRPNSGRSTVWASVQSTREQMGTKSFNKDPLFSRKSPILLNSHFKKVSVRFFLWKSLIFDKISFEQGKRHFRTPPRPSTRHLEKNPLSTTVFKGLTSCSVSFSFSRLRKNVFQNKLFQVLIWLYKAFIVLMVGTTHTTCCFSRSQTSSYLTFRSFIKMQWRK